MVSLCMTVMLFPYCAGVEARLSVYNTSVGIATEREGVPQRNDVALVRVARQGRAADEREMVRMSADGTGCGCDLLTVRGQPRWSLSSPDGNLRAAGHHDSPAR
jgi:hypothetical protein